MQNPGHYHFWQELDRPCARRTAYHSGAEPGIDSSSLAYLRPHAQSLFYDAEHFFDGFRADPDYALTTLAKALESKADCLVLCDTNGGNLPGTIRDVMAVVKERFPTYAGDSCA